MKFVQIADRTEFCWNERKRPDERVAVGEQD